MKAKLLIAASALFPFALFLGGCNNTNKPTPENFTKTINAFYQDRDDCVFAQPRHFPYEVGPGPSAKQEKAQMDSLMDSGLLKRLEDRDLHVDSYSLLPAGTRAGARLCYGHREVTSIDGSTPPGPHNGFTETTVTYHYHMVDVPMWVQTDEVKAAFPDVAKDLSDSPSDQITLATVGAGWQVPH